MGFAFSHFLCQLGVSFLCERDPSFLARFFCWQLSQEGLDGLPPLYFLDFMVGEKQTYF